MNHKHMIGSAVAALALGMALPASATNYAFSYLGQRFTQGMVYGTLYDMGGNGEVTPDKILVEPVRPSYDLYNGIYMNSAWLTDISGAFDVVNGQIVGGEVQAIDGNTSVTLYGDGSYGLVQEGNGAQPGGGEILYDAQYAITEGGSPVVYSAYTSAAPEPGRWALMLAGVTMIGYSLRNFRRRGMSAIAA